MSSTMKNLIVLIFSLQLLGCADFRNFNPESNRYVLIIELYDTLGDVQKVCGKGKAGCFERVGSVNKVHTIKERCVFDHEMDHLFFGPFHGDRSAGCKTRAD